MLTSEQKQLVSATVPVLKENGVLLTKHFYKRMFSFNPELKNVFNMGNQASGKQQTSLALAVLAYAENIEDPSVLFPAVDRIAHKHTSVDIRPEHYAIVGHHLLESIREVLGDAATEPLIAAWGAAYGQLAKLMSGHEANLYQQMISHEGGWTGWKPFIIKNKLAESDEITSFHLYPADGGPVPSHLPGQYLSVRVFLPELNLTQPRQYSISNAPNNLYFRISVKRELGNTHANGMISNFLHDHINVGDRIEVTAPAGNFVLNDEEKSPVVFISGGVGQTPLISMLESLLDKNASRPIKWLHGCRNEQVHAFKQPIEYWTSTYENLESHIFYNDLSETDSSDNIHEGILDINQLEDRVVDPDAEYYICGPAPFIEKQFNDLIAKGIKKQMIYFEEFGPQVLSLN